MLRLIRGTELVADILCCGHKKGGGKKKGGTRKEEMRGLSFLCTQLHEVRHDSQEKICNESSDEKPN